MVRNMNEEFKVETKLEDEGLKFYNVLSAPFEVYGVKMLDGKFRRMPEEIAAKVSEDVLCLHDDTAGGRVKFRTDSPYIAVNIRIARPDKMSHFALTGSVGLDVYVNENGEENYFRTIKPPFEIDEDTVFESLVYFDTEGMRDVTVNFPLYSEVSELYIGLDEKAALEAPTPYIDKKPIVFYGSSITQGGCASRPGNCYEAYISRRFNCDYINLGFSNSAKAEDTMVDYISKLDMSMFVCDYDHNAPTEEHLRETHEKMFKAIRRENPDIPIVIMSAPVWDANDFWKKRREIIETTYKNALASGDENVYFLNGDDLMKICENNGTVDNIHPNDLGFFSMAKALGDLIEKIWA